MKAPRALVLMTFAGAALLGLAAVGVLFTPAASAFPFLLGASLVLARFGIPAAEKAVAAREAAERSAGWSGAAFVRPATPPDLAWMTTAPASVHAARDAADAPVQEASAQPVPAQREPAGQTIKAGGFLVDVTAGGAR